MGVRRRIFGSAAMILSASAGQCQPHVRSPARPDVGIVVTAVPARPWIERGEEGQSVGVDLVIRNATPARIRVCEIEVRVVDRAGDTTFDRTLNANGFRPSIDVVVPEAIAAGETRDVFAPLDAFDPRLSLARLDLIVRYRHEPDTSAAARNRHRLPFDFDGEANVTVSPRTDEPHVALRLPLEGRLLVWDGHDLFSHHRRIPLDDPRVRAEGIAANANRYAADLVRVDARGALWRDDPWDKHHWLTFGADVLAPAAGTIAAARNDVPDNELSRDGIRSPSLPAEEDDALGNYVIIDHGNHEYSVLPHLEAGSVVVRPGERVATGQRLGHVGFSGDAIFPHVHQTLVNSPDVRRAEGIPARFAGLGRWRDGHLAASALAPLVSGDVVQNLAIAGATSPSP